MRSKNRLVLQNAITVSSDGSLPLFIPVLPAGRRILGRDGREYLNPDPFRVISLTMARGTDTPIDLNHSSENGDGRAIGWIKDFHIRSDGSVWGEVSEWGPDGIKALQNKEFRYISPAFYTEDDPDEETDGIIEEISSVGLVNSPNFDMPALNKGAENTNNNRSTNKMDPKELRKNLGLAETATDEEVVARIAELDKAAKEVKDPAQPVLNAVQIEKMVSTAVQNAVAPLITRQTEDHAALVEKTIDGYVQAGKIPPSDETRKFWLNQAGTPEGLKKTCEYLDQLPVMVSTKDQVSGKPGDKKPVLNADERKICKMIGVSEEDYLKTDIDNLYGGETV